MIGKHTNDTQDNKALLNIVAQAGPTLAHIKPIRKAIVTSFEKTIAENCANDTRYPIGVREDRAVMGKALVHTVERGIAENQLAPAVVDKVIHNLVGAGLMDKGEPEIRAKFRQQFGTHAPGFAVISPGKGCNLHCTGCYANSSAINPEKLEWDTFDRILTEMETLWGARFVVISGGEPFVYRSQGKGIIEAAEKHSNCFFLVFTNGTLIDDEVAERLAAVGNITPAISVEGWQERTDQRRGEGIFNKILETMARLRKAGVPFGISLTATRENCSEILSDEFIDFFFNEQKALYGWSFHYMPIGRSVTLDLMPTPEQRRWMWRRSWELVRDRQIFLADFWNHGTIVDGCLAGGHSYLYIDWNGKVSPCVFVPYSPVNINTIYEQGGTLIDVWKEPFFAAIRGWQGTYGNQHDGKIGNWLAPCIIRDHYADFKELVEEYQPEPSDPAAEEALADEAYAEGMENYGVAYQNLCEPIWEKHYNAPVEMGNQDIRPLPETPVPNSGSED